MHASQQRHSSTYIHAHAHADHTYKRVAAANMSPGKPPLKTVKIV
jgi:hypothetical protein